MKKFDTSELNNLRIEQCSSTFLTAVCPSTIFQEPCTLISCYLLLIFPSFSSHAPLSLSTNPTSYHDLRYKYTEYEVKSKTRLYKQSQHEVKRKKSFSKEKRLYFCLTAGVAFINLFGCRTGLQYWMIGALYRFPVKCIGQKPTCRLQEKMERMTKVLTKQPCFLR